MLSLARAALALSVCSRGPPNTDGFPIKPAPSIGRLASTALSEPKKKHWSNSNADALRQRSRRSSSRSCIASARRCSAGGSERTRADSELSMRSCSTLSPDEATRRSTGGRERTRADSEPSMRSCSTLSPDEADRLPVSALAGLTRSNGFSEVGTSATERPTQSSVTGKDGIRTASARQRVHDEDEPCMGCRIQPGG